MPPQASGVASEFRWVCEMVSFSGELLPSVVSFKKVLRFAARRKGAKEEKVAADACDAVPVQPALEPVQPALEPVVKRSKRKRYRFPIPYIFVSRLGPLDKTWEVDEMFYQNLFQRRGRNAANHWLYRFYVTHQSCNAKRYWPIGLCQLTWLGCAGPWKQGTTLVGSRADACGSLQNGQAVQFPYPSFHVYVYMCICVHIHIHIYTYIHVWLVLLLF